MDKTINVKQLRASLPETIARVRRGERFTVLYRSRPAFRIVPVQDAGAGTLPPLADEPLYRATALGRSAGGNLARDHDAILYGTPSPEPRRSRRR